MTTNKERYVSGLLETVLEIKPDFKTFYNVKLKHKAPDTQLNNLRVFKEFFLLVKNSSPEEIEKFIASEYYSERQNSSKNVINIIVRKWLKFRGLLESFGVYFEKHQIKYAEINKNELITKSDLAKIIKICDAKKRAMIMVNYEGALRRGELSGIRYKDIQFDEQTNRVRLYVETSKTAKRNIRLKDSVPFLREYFSMNEFKPDSKIFDFAINYLNILYKRLGEKSGINKRLHPHLLRHSRLTELAVKNVNESKIRRFAGWTKKSTMVERYIHLDDDDLDDIDLGSPIKAPEKIDDPMMCMVCDKSKRIAESEEKVKTISQDNLDMKRLVLTLYAKTNGFDTIEELEEKDGKLENTKVKIIVSVDDKVNEEITKRENEIIQYLAKIKKDLE